MTRLNLRLTQPATASKTDQPDCRHGRRQTQFTNCMA
jgi:hypothetical protein